MRAIRKTTIDQDIRDKILADQGNIIVTANAGSGKTTILTDKLQQDAELETNHYKYLALTFTNMAVEEIKTKIVSQKNDLNNIQIQTINSFVLKEIIIPFINSKYPKIDRSLLRTSYVKKVDSYKQGLELVEEQQIIGTYNNLESSNFLLDLAVDLISNYNVVRQYIVSKYSKIYIDEYQDCDKSMHTLFQYFSDNLKIPLFIVGDVKQSIYQWRGASPEYLNQIIKNKNFTAYQLIENFRSVPNIISYVNSIAGIPCQQTYKEYQSILYINLDGVYLSNEHRAIVIKKFLDLNYLNGKEEIGILLGNNKDIANVQNYLIELGVDTFEVIQSNELTKLENKFSDNIARCYFNEGYNEFNFIEDVIRNDNKQLDYLIIVDQVYNIFNKLRSNQSLNNMNELFNFLDKFIEVIDNSDKNEILKFIRNKDNVKHYQINRDKISHTLMTTHSAKGKSIDQVVIFTDYYDYKNQFKKEDNYVGVTRAKSKLILVDYSGKYADHIDNHYKNIGIDNTFESFVSRIKLED